MSYKVNGFNVMEQRIFDALVKENGPMSIRQLKSLFTKEAKDRCSRVYEAGWGETEIDVQAQSFVRNSIRRLVRDEWAEQTGRGTYCLSKAGRDKIKKDIHVTKSIGESQRGRKKKTVKKERAEKAKVRAARKIDAKPKEKKAKAKKAKVVKAKVSEKVVPLKEKKAKKTTPKNGKPTNGVNTKKLEELRAKTKRELLKESALNAEG